MEKNRLNHFFYFSTSVPVNGQFPSGQTAGFLLAAFPWFSPGSAMSAPSDGTDQPAGGWDSVSALRHGLGFSGKPRFSPQWHQKSPLPRDKLFRGIFSIRSVEALEKPSFCPAVRCSCLFRGCVPLPGITPDITYSNPSIREGLCPGSKKRCPPCLVYVFFYVFAPESKHIENSARGKS